MWDGELVASSLTSECRQITTHLARFLWHLNLQ